MLSFVSGQMIPKVARNIMQCSAEVVQLEEVHSYLKESLTTMKLPEKPKDKATLKLKSCTCLMSSMAAI